VSVSQIHLRVWSSSFAPQPRYFGRRPTGARDIADARGSKRECMRERAFVKTQRVAGKASISLLSLSPALRVSRCRPRSGERPTNRSYATVETARKQFVFDNNNPQPGVVRELYPWTAMCVRNVDVHVSCSSQVDAQLAAFFIDPRAK